VRAVKPSMENTENGGGGGSPALRLKYGNREYLLFFVSKVLLDSAGPSPEPQQAAAAMARRHALLAHGMSRGAAVVGKRCAYFEAP
jgi:hypothetical protein